MIGILMLRIAAIIVLIAICGISSVAQIPNGNGTLPGQGNPAPVPSRIRVSGNVMLAMFEHKVMPMYPDEAMLKGIQGDVWLKVEIDETGKPLFAVPVEGNPLLMAASVEAIRESRFRPFLLNGTPVTVETQSGFHFAAETKDGTASGRVDCITSIPDRPEFRTGVARDAGVLILDPHRISGPEPRMPAELEGKTGSVYLIIAVGEDGKVQDVKVAGGDEAFIAPVVDAVKQQVYEPRLVNGHPSVARIEASYHFGLRR